MSGFLPGLCDLLDKDEIPSKPQANTQHHDDLSSISQRPEVAGADVDDDSDDSLYGGDKTPEQAQNSTRQEPPTSNAQLPEGADDAYDDDDFYNYSDNGDETIKQAQTSTQQESLTSNAQPPEVSDDAGDLLDEEDDEEDGEDQEGFEYMAPYLGLIGRDIFGQNASPSQAQAENPEDTPSQVTSQASTKAANEDLATSEVMDTTTAPSDPPPHTYGNSLTQQPIHDGSRGGETPGDPEDATAASAVLVDSDQNKVEKKQTPHTNQDYATEKTALLAEVGGLKFENGELKSEVRELKVEARESKIEAGELKQEVETLQAALKESQAEVQALQTERGVSQGKHREPSGDEVSQDGGSIKRRKLDESTGKRPTGPSTLANEHLSTMSLDRKSRRAQWGSDEDAVMLEEGDVMSKEKMAKLLEQGQ